MQPTTPYDLPKFNAAAVLVVGDIMLDRYWFGETSRISPEAPVPIVKINGDDDRPGGAANVALNIAALGTQVELMGIIGQDEAGDLLVDRLTAAGIKASCVREHNAKTTVKLRVISKHQQLLRLDFEDSLKLTITAQKQLKNNFAACLDHYQLIVLSDYQKGTLADPQPLIQAAKQKKLPVLVDPKGQDFNIYKGATILTPNYKEFIAIVGPCKNEQDILFKGQKLLHDCDLQALLITRGEYGMTLIEAESSQHFPAYAREVFDVTGAGDTVIATLAACLANGTSLAKATAIANIAASIVVSKLGATTVTVPELEAALNRKSTINAGIVNEEQLLQAVNTARSQGKKIVFTNGCFDILHAGHVKCLEMAKELADFLIVAVNSDSSIQAIKGPTRPINKQDHRLSVLAGIGAVDWVVAFSDPTPERLLKLIQPDFLVKGGDYRVDQVVGADIVKAYGGEVRIMNHGITTSSTSILKHLQE